MNFPDAVKSGFENYFNFEGRARRSEYWWWFLFYIIAYASAIGIDVMLSLGMLSLVVSLALMAPSLALGARRLHDINKSGWWQLLLLIPLIGMIILMVLAAKQGDASENRFGKPRV